MYKEQNWPWRKCQLFMNAIAYVFGQVHLWQMLKSVNYILSVSSEITRRGNVNIYTYNGFWHAPTCYSDNLAR